MVIQWSYEGSRWQHYGRSCRNRMSYISFALAAYHEDHGAYPPAFLADEKGTPIHSWRVLLLPYLDHKELYEKYRFDEPWNGPRNRRLAGELGTYQQTFSSSVRGKEIPFFTCPGQHDVENSTFTNYVAIVGPGTAWPNPNEPLSNKNIDPQSSALRFIEIHNSDIHWMEPRDITLDDLHVSTLNKVLPTSNHHSGPEWFWQHREPYINASDLQGSKRIVPLTNPANIPDFAKLTKGSDPITKLKPINRSAHLHDVVIPLMLIVMGVVVLFLATRSWAILVGGGAGLLVGCLLSMLLKQERLGDPINADEGYYSTGYENFAESFPYALLCCIIGIVGCNIIAICIREKKSTTSEPM